MNQAPVTAETIFGKAIAIAQADQRADFIDQACGDDPPLHREVKRLVVDYFRAGNFLQNPAVAFETVPGHPRCESVGTQIGRY